MVNKKIIKRIRKNLPKDFVKRLKKRLDDKGLKYSHSYIRKVLNPEDESKINLDILDEASFLAQEHKRSTDEILSRINKN